MLIKQQQLEQQSIKLFDFKINQNIRTNYFNQFISISRDKEINHNQNQTNKNMPPNDINKAQSFDKTSRFFIVK